MDRSYLVLLFAGVFFGILVIYGVYVKMSAPDPGPAATEPTTKPLVEKLREERERRMREHEPATTTIATQPSS